MSWHSTGFQQAHPQALLYPTQFQPHAPSSYFLGPTSTTSEVNGAITPMSHPLAGEPFVQDVFTPLDSMSSQDFDHRYAFLNEFSADKYPIPSLDYETWYSLSAESGNPIPQYEYLKQPESNHCQIELTAPPTPEARPLQAAAGIPTGNMSVDLVHTAATDDLVGMGLYDAPSPMPATMSFLSGTWDIPIRPGLGKGLKLEETFQPTTQEDDEDDAASGEDGDEEEYSEVQAHGSELPCLGFEDKGFYDEQNTAANSNLAPDFTSQENAWWSMNAATNYRWV